MCDVPSCSTQQHDDHVVPAHNNTTTTYPLHASIATGSWAPPSKLDACSSESVMEFTRIEASSAFPAVHLKLINFKCCRNVSEPTAFVIMSAVLFLPNHVVVVEGQHGHCAAVLNTTTTRQDDKTTAHTVSVRRQQHNGMSP